MRLIQDLLKLCLGIDSLHRLRGRVGVGVLSEIQPPALPLVTSGLHTGLVNPLPPSIKGGSFVSICTSVSSERITKIPLTPTLPSHFRVEAKAIHFPSEDQAG